MNHPFIEMYNKNWKNHTFFFKEELSEECWKDVQRLCETNDKRLGYYIYHSHVMKNGEPIFDGMKVAYYIRNPFHKWRKYKVYHS